MHPVFARILHDREPGERFTERGTCIESSAGTAYYAKLGGAREHEQWAGEAAALRAMRAAAPGLAPEPFAFGAADADGNDVAPDAPSARTYFLSAYSDHGGLTDAAARTLGRRLAGEMHRYESPEGRFGFGVPTYCGATRFENGWHETWAGCFDAMVGQMLGYLRERGKFASLQRKGALLRERVIPHLLGSLDVRPVLLHGDLWSGNTGADRKTGQPIIFDAASYYGHNEADLGIARMFGGIPRAFFTEYHAHMPKTAPEEQYKLRADLYELFHYLNHTVLFGGGYAGTAEAKIDALLKACP